MDWKQFLAYISGSVERSHPVYLFTGMEDAEDWFGYGAVQGGKDMPCTATVKAEVSHEPQQSWSPPATCSAFLFFWPMMYKAFVLFPTSFDALMVNPASIIMAARSSGEKECV